MSNTEPTQPPYTHQQLWELAWKWWEIAENIAVDEGTRCGYKECADQLSELLGPLAFAQPSIFQSAGQTKQYGPRPRIATRPPGFR